MAIETLKELFARDLKRLRNKVKLYNNENNIWRVEKNIADSAGNLCLFFNGQLNT